jgi:hypothetical protein
MTQQEQARPSKVRAWQGSGNRCALRQPPPAVSPLRARAHRNGLRDVKEARTSPLYHPESNRLATPLSQILRKNSVDSIIFRQKHNFFNLQKNVVRHFFAAFWSSNAAKFLCSDLK